jgi:hypothetical protein
MAKKEYNVITRTYQAQPRSKRLRALGNSTTTGGVSVTATTTAVEGHTHDNKATLDALSTDDEGYLYVRYKPEDASTSVTEKVHAGYADESAHASRADDASQWSGHEFDDYVDQPVRMEDKVSFLEVRSKGFRTEEYLQGSKGAAVDEAGNAELESLRVRSFMEVYELIYNRLNALEGNTSFADVGTIDGVQEQEDGTWRLSMRRRWSGDYTAFQVGDVVYGYVNDLTAEGTYYKCWMRIVAVDTDADVLTAVLYADGDTPAGRNYAPTESMVITRWGNAIEPSAESYATYPSVIHSTADGYVNVRRDAFYISCEDGNLVQLMGVYQPKIERTNYGTVLGRIPSGLLSDALPINTLQPYLYARGIVVQDLIRINYEGSIVRTERYRGAWALAIADSEDSYSSTNTSFDTVTHNGALWQCAASGTLDEPTDATGSWVRMSGSSTEPVVALWSIVPSVNIVSVRQEGVTPNVVSCTVERHSTAGEEHYLTSYGLQQAGCTLYYALDDGPRKVFVIGSDEPLETDDGEELTLEDDTATMLTLGGDDVDASLIEDRITFYLVDNDSDALLTQVVVPVVKDGADGAKGAEGRLIYPAGVFNQDMTYVCTAEKAPVVYYAERYYVMIREGHYCGASATYATPAEDVANNSNPMWALMSDFAAVFAEILFASFAKLGSAIFYGDYLFSQNGTLDGSSVEGSDDDGVAYYRRFTDGVTAGTFIPNLMLNLRTGEIVANNATVKGTIDASSGHIGGFSIGQDHIGVNADLSSASGEGMSLFPGFIKFSDADWTRVAMVGTSTYPSSSGITVLGRFENTYSSPYEPYATNYGLSIIAKNAAYNLALIAQGNVVSQGLVTSSKMWQVTLNSGEVNIDEQFDCNVWLVKCTASNSHIALPRRSTVRRQLGLEDGKPFSVRIVIIADAASTASFKVQGRNTQIYDANNTYFLDSAQYPYRLDNSGKQCVTDGLSLSAGDVAEFQLVYDGETYNAYYLNYRT